MEETKRTRRKETDKEKPLSKLEDVPSRGLEGSVQSKSHNRRPNEEQDLTCRVASRELISTHKSNTASRHQEREYYKARDTFDDTGYHRNPAEDTSTVSDMTLLAHEQKRQQREIATGTSGLQDQELKGKTQAREGKREPNRENDGKEAYRKEPKRQHEKPMERHGSSEKLKSEKAQRESSHRKNRDTHEHPVARVQEKTAQETSETNQQTRKKRDQPKESREARRERKLKEKEGRSEPSRKEKRNDAKVMQDSKLISTKKASVTERLCFSDSEVDFLYKALQTQRRQRTRRDRKDSKIRAEKSEAKLDRQKTKEVHPKHTTDSHSQPGNQTSERTVREAGAAKTSAPPSVDAPYAAILKVVEEPTPNGDAKAEAITAKAAIDLTALQDSESYYDELSQGIKHGLNISTMAQTKLTRLLFVRVKELLREVEDLAKDRRSLQEKLQSKEEELSKLRTFEEHQKEREKKLTERLELLADDITVTAKGSNFNQKVQLILRDVQSKYCDQWKEHEDRMKRVQDEAEREIQGLMRDIVAKYAEISEIKSRTGSAQDMAPSYTDERSNTDHDANELTAIKDGAYRSCLKKSQLAGLKNTNQLLLKIAQPLKPLSIDIEEENSDPQKPAPSERIPHATSVGGRLSSLGTDASGCDETDKPRPFYQPLSLKLDAKEFWRHKLLQPVDQPSNDLLKPVGILNKSVLPPISMANPTQSEKDLMKSNSRRMAL